MRTESRRDPGVGAVPRRRRPTAAAMLAAVILIAPRVAAEPAATGDLPDFDPNQAVGGMDIWVARLGPDGTHGPPVNLGPNVNSTRRESSPVISPDGQRLFFSSRGRADGMGREDLYVCEWQGGGWGPAANLGAPVNTALEELGPCLYPDGVTLLFSRKDEKQKAFDFLLTVRVEGEWLEPIALGEPIHTAADERMASITADGQQLFFSAMYRGSRGVFDLYMSYKDDVGRWTDPLNLGPRVNSDESDYSPGISPDGKRLYFSSQRDEPGNFDLYMSELVEGGSWSEPVRLPPPINSRATEYCPFVAADGSLYFASDRRRGDIRPPEIEE